MWPLYTAEEPLHEENIVKINFLEMDLLGPRVASVLLMVQP
jgi:hypothetical protein